MLPRSLTTKHTTTIKVKVRFVNILLFVVVNCSSQTLRKVTQISTSKVNSSFPVCVGRYIFRRDLSLALQFFFNTFFTILCCACLNHLKSCNARRFSRAFHFSVHDNRFVDIFHSILGRFQLELSSFCAMYFEFSPRLCCHFCLVSVIHN